MRKAELEKTFEMRVDATKKILDAYKEVFDTDSGKIVFRDILYHSNLYGSSRHSDVCETLRLEGRRDVALLILHRTDPEEKIEDYITYYRSVMAQENASPILSFKPPQL